MEKNRPLLIFFASFSLFHLCFSNLPHCYQDGRKCGFEGDNLISYNKTGTVSECRALCQNESLICTTFTYFGPDSSLFANTCFLFESCENTFPCNDCITERVEPGDCLCSIPYECNAGYDSMAGILENVFSEEYCKRICYDTKECTTYTYYDQSHQESPQLCVLQRGCHKTSMEPCPGNSCHTGPGACTRNETEECSFAVWAPHMEDRVLFTNNEVVTLMTGERNCYKQVKGLAVGGGGGSVKYKGGGGSGYVNTDNFNVSAHDRISVIIGQGASGNVTATSTRVMVDTQVLLEGPPGVSANRSSFNGADGYSGGGGLGGNGGEDGGDGKDGSFIGGKGNNLKLSLVDPDFSFELTPGTGGVGDSSLGGGGGGGVVVDGIVPLATNDYQGEGFGGGAGGSDEANGLPGCAVLELMNRLPLFNKTHPQP